MPQTRESYYTAEEFLNMIPETSERTELYDGTIVAQAAPNEQHHDITAGIYSDFRSFIRENAGSCKVFIAPFDVVLDDKNVVQPDVFVVCDPDKRDGKRINGVPDLVVEVTSTNSSNDYNKKLELYRKFGVREYWIVDPGEKRTIVYQFGDTDRISFYTFDIPIPVGIYDGKLEICINELL